MRLQSSLRGCLDVFWVVTPFGIVPWYRCLGRRCCPHLQGLKMCTSLKLWRQILFTGWCRFPLHPAVADDVRWSSFLAPGIDQWTTGNACGTGVYLLASLRIENHIILDKRHISLWYEPCISFWLPTCCSIIVSLTRDKSLANTSLAFPAGFPWTKNHNIFDKRHTFLTQALRFLLASNLL